MSHNQTPSQTVGPYFAYGLTSEQYGYRLKKVVDHDMAPKGTDGERISIIGQVLDGEGTPISDAMIEIWQANAHGRYNHPADDRVDNKLDPNFSGFGRVGTGTDPENNFFFDTVKPGPIGDGQAPHLSVVVMMRGLLTHAYTRIYFSDEADANAADQVLMSVPEERRDTLIAKRVETEKGIVYRFDIRMQGDKETVFFDL